MSCSLSELESLESLDSDFCRFFDFLDFFGFFDFDDFFALGDSVDADSDPLDESRFFAARFNDNRLTDDRREDRWEDFGVGERRLFEMDLDLERDFLSGTGGGEIDFRRGVNDLLIDLRFCFKSRVSTKNLSTVSGGILTKPR